VSFQPRSSSFQRIRPRPPAGSETRGSFAVGSQVLLTATTPGQKQLELIDVDGMPTGVHLPVDEPTVITAWRPRRAAPARYRVRSAAGVEGWIDAPNLRRPPAPPPPPPPIVAAPVVPPKAKSAPSTPKPRPAAKPAKPATSATSATSAKPSLSARPRVQPKAPKKPAKKASPRKRPKRAR
jgi:hypothetical protein